MSLMRFSPSPELEEFPVGLRLFQDSVSRLFGEPSNHPWSPAVDIFETEHELVLKADVPEIEMKDIDVQVENGTLTLKGERKFEQEQNGRGYHRIERGSEPGMNANRALSAQAAFVESAPVARLRVRPLSGKGGRGGEALDVLGHRRRRIYRVERGGEPQRGRPQRHRGQRFAR